MSNMAVTAIVKYDLFPRYRVIKGRLLPNGNVQLIGSTSYMKAEHIIRILPLDQFEEEEKKKDKLVSDYREKELKLRLDLLEQAGVDYI
ncbi:hypothetical protein A54_265 [Septuagintavirus sv54]|uniref:Uncharacterized protein n=1 Tax=Escherichia phage A5-4 TaxID=2996162 RepID=A0AAE9TFM3_9CAUD|nr:hypothetical protein [Escherichia phage UPEC06]UZZ64229.1 hypothetical protein A54_265 [Escherichia phage A5-4]